MYPRKQKSEFPFLKLFSEGEAKVTLKKFEDRNLFIHKVLFDLNWAYFKNRSELAMWALPLLFHTWVEI